MEQQRNLLTDGTSEPISSPNGRLFTSGQVALGVFLCSSIMGAYMMAHNCRLLGRGRRAMSVWGVALCLQVVVLFLWAVLPYMSLLATFIAAVLAVVAYCVARRWWVAVIAERVEGGGRLQGWSRVLLVCISLCVVFHLTFILLFLNSLTDI